MISSGLYPGVSYHDYASWPAVRASTLNACARTMAHGRQAEIEEKDDTAALAFGTAFHSAVLEPDQFRRDYIVAPACDRRTRDGKEEWTAFVEASAGRLPITQADHAAAEAMIRGVYGNRDCAELLANAKARELSFVWRDDATGLMCKARIDLLTTYAGWTVIVDLKSTADASRGGFQRQMTSLGYYRQLAWYRMGLQALSPVEEPRRCALIAVEKAPPYLAKAYELDGEALAIGEQEMRELLARYAEARASGVWGGYGDDMAGLSLPTWKVRENEQRFDSAA